MGVAVAFYRSIWSASLIALSFFGASSPAGSEPLGNGEANVVEYGCSDVVALGRIKTLAYDDLTTDNDLLGRGRFTMRVSLTRIFRGNEKRKVVAAYQIAHGRLRADRDFIIVLSPNGHGDYTLKSATLSATAQPPIIAQKCVDT